MHPTLLLRASVIYPRALRRSSPSSGGNDRILAGVPRLSVWGTVPHGLSQEELLANVCFATATAYAGSATKLGAVTVFAYRDTITSGGFTAGRGVFAPGGQWEKADPNEPLANWKLSAEVAPGYVNAVVPLANGTVVTLADKDDKTVEILERCGALGQRRARRRCAERNKGTRGLAPRVSERGRNARSIRGHDYKRPEAPRLGSRLRGAGRREVTGASPAHAIDSARGGTQ